MATNKCDIHEDVRLAGEIEKYPCLYDKRLETYKDLEVKKNAWRDIEHALGYNEGWAEKKFEILKKRYSRKRVDVKRAEQCGASSNYMSKVKKNLQEYEFLAWLEPHIRHKRSSTIKGNQAIWGEPHYPGEEMIQIDRVHDSSDDSVSEFSEDIDNFIKQEKDENLAGSGQRFMYDTNQPGISSTNQRESITVNRFESTEVSKTTIQGIEETKTSVDQGPLRQPEIAQRIHNNHQWEPQLAQRDLHRVERETSPSQDTDRAQQQQVFGFQSRHEPVRRNLSAQRDELPSSSSGVPQGSQKRLAPQKTHQDEIFGKMIAGELSMFDENLKFEVKHELNNVIYKYRLLQKEKYAQGYQQYQQ